MKNRKFLSWKGISIYLTIILFLLIFIQFMDQNKRAEKEGQYLAEVETAYHALLDFQTHILTGDVVVDANKEVITMSERNFQYQLSMFIDIFGNPKKDDESLYDYYKKIDEQLTAFAEATSTAEQQKAHDQLVELKKPFFALIDKLK